MINKIDAILSLIPNAEVCVRGEEVEWIVKPLNIPSDEEINNELLKLESEYNAKDYQRKRVMEYPPFTEYLDGIVKNDKDQIQTYIDACLAVKVKYPKEAK